MAESRLESGLSRQRQRPWSVQVGLCPYSWTTGRKCPILIRQAAPRLLDIGQPAKAATKGPRRGPFPISISVSSPSFCRGFLLFPPCLARHWGRASFDASGGAISLNAVPASPVSPPRRASCKCAVPASAGRTFGASIRPSAFRQTKTTPAHAVIEAPQTAPGAVQVPALRARGSREEAWRPVEAGAFACLPLASRRSPASPTRPLGTVGLHVVPIGRRLPAPPCFKIALELIHQLPPAGRTSKTDPRIYEFPTTHLRRSAHRRLNRPGRWRRHPRLVTRPSFAALRLCNQIILP